jgi:predicted secreted protein
MKMTSAIAVYFVIWWTVLFMILPLGVRNAAEAGEKVGEGHDAGAPIAHGLGRKAVITTFVATAVFAMVYIVMANNWLETIDLPFLPKI